MAVNKQKITTQAQKYTAKGHLEKAILEYKKLLKIDPNDIRTWLKMGDLYTRMGARREATDTYLEVAEHYKKNGFHLKAVAVYKQVLKLDPTLIDIYELLADAYMGLGLTSEALIKLEQLADVFQRTEQNSRLIQVLLKMAEADPQNVSTRLRMAEQLSKDGNKEQAIEQFSMICDQLKQEGRMDDYFKVAERLMYHDSSRGDVAQDLASLYLEKEQPKRALSKLQVCFKQDPKNIKTLELLAQAFVALEQPEKAVSVYQEMTHFLAEKGNTQEEQRIKKIILSMNSDNEVAHNHLEKSSQASNASDEIANSSEDHEVNDATKFLKEAEVLLKYGLKERTIAHIQKIFDFDYYNLDARELLKDLFIEDGKKDKAVEQLFILADGFVKEQPEGSIYYLHQILAIDPFSVRARDMIRQIGGVMPEGLPELSSEDADVSFSEVQFHSQASIKAVKDEETAQVDHADNNLENLSIDDIPYVEPENEFSELDIDDDLTQDVVKDDGFEVDLDEESLKPDDLEEVDDFEEIEDLDEIENSDEIEEIAAPIPPKPSLYPKGPIATGLSAPILPQPSAALKSEGEKIKVSLPPPKSTTTSASVDKTATAAPDNLPDIADELAEIEFFMSQGLEDEAATIVETLTGQYPDDLRVKQAAALLTIEDDDEPENTLESKSTLDLDKMDDDIELDDITNDEGVNEIDDSLSTFKIGVEKQISESDYSTHYDLGMAYKEMGLFEDAISKFKMVMNEPSYADTAKIMIGLCNVSSGDLENAENVFNKLLANESTSKDSRLAVMYELGKLYEIKGSSEDALKIYNSILALDPDFADVMDRIDTISSGERGPSNDSKLFS